jgi:hydrogenase maturation protease
MAAPRTALVGIGNIMFRDEGLGVYAVEYIARNFDIPTDLSVVEGGALGFTLMPYFQEYDRVLVVVSGSRGEVPGEIRVYESIDAFLQEGQVRKSANETELAMMLEICAFSEKMADVHIVTMLPEDIESVANGLTDTILKAMPDLIDTIVGRLQHWGLTLRPEAEGTSLETILHHYANPTQSVQIPAGASETTKV